MLLALAVALSSYAQVNVVTANYGAARTGANLNETILNPTTVSPATFGKLFTLPVDGQIYAQPLYLSAVNLPQQGVHNIVITVTQHNSVYAFDADSGGLLWQVNLGPSVSNLDYAFIDVNPQVGILSTPVIDLATYTVYVVANTIQNGAHVYTLHALDATSGQERFGGPCLISAWVPGSGPDSENGLVTFNASQHLQRPGLLLLNGAVYIAFGSHGDGGVYHGWVVAYDAANVNSQLAAYNVTPNGKGGALWQSGHGLAADGDGNIYAAIGNGDFDGVSNFGQCFLKLSPSLQMIDWFVPNDWKRLNRNDEDFGSSGPVWISSVNGLIGGGKSGVLYLLDPIDLGHDPSGSSRVIQSLPAVSYWGSDGGIFGITVWERDYGPVVYVQGQGEGVKAFQIVNGAFDPQPISQSSVPSPSPYAGVSISANGGDATTGIAWVTIPDFRDPLNPAPGTLHAFNASDLSEELWNSSLDPDADALGYFAKFAIPTVANGKVYVPTFSNQVVVYGLLPTQ